MDEADWYKIWRAGAADELQAKNKALTEEFKLGSWERYDIDLAEGRLVFSQGGAAKVTASVQVVGTTSTAAANWLWAWGNAALPAAVTADARAARVFGEEHGAAELTSKYLASAALDDLGWHLSAVTARVAHSKGVYRAPTKTGLLFLVFREVKFVG